MALSLLHDTSTSGVLVAAMKDTLSERNNHTGGRCDSPSINNNNNHREVSSTAAALATAALSGLHHSSALLGPGQLFAGHINPLHLRATLATTPALYQTHFGWPHTTSVENISPPSSNHNALKKNNNHLLTSNNAVSVKNHINSRSRRGPRKLHQSEHATIEMSPVNNITSSTDPPSPARPASSPPTINGNKNGNGDKTFTCGVCNRSFGYKHVLQNHERTHTGEKPFECPQCQKRFTRDHHLKTHIRLHTGEKPYKCEYCDRQFVQVANLRRHTRVHTGDRPYACELCTSRFSDSNQLKAHMLIHQNLKPFECLKCRGHYRRRHHLISHKCPGRDAENEQTDGKLKTLLTQNVEIKDTRVVSEDDEEEEEEMEVEEEEDVLTESRDSGVILTHNNNSSKTRIRKPQEIRHVIRMPGNPRPLSPPVILSNSLAITSVLPEQTEPEDLSMNARSKNGYQSASTSHSSGSPLSLSRSPTSEEEENSSPALFLRHPKFRRHLQTGGIS